jgi:hypothetical protein
VTIRTDVDNALRSQTVDGREADDLTDEIFTALIAVLRKNFGIPLADLELMLADVRRDTENKLFGAVHNTIDCDTAVDVIVSRFFGEDD